MLYILNNSCAIRFYFHFFGKSYSNLFLFKKKIFDKSNPVNVLCDLKRCLVSFSNTLKCVKGTPLRAVISTLFWMF